VDPRIILVDMKEEKNFAHAWIRTAKSPAHSLLAAPNALSVVYDSFNGVLDSQSNRVHNYCEQRTKQYGWKWP
jgi:hypothetical protein